MDDYGRFRGKWVKLLNLRTTGRSVYQRSALSDVTVTNLATLLALVVQTLDSAIHRINHYPMDKDYGNQLRYSLDSDLSGG